MNFNQKLQHLNQLTGAEFLKQYWQKKPLLIRNAFPEFATSRNNPLSPDELAGLATEKDVHARIIRGSHQKDDWQLEYGPFDAARFAKLKGNDWSLLVSDVEKHLPYFAKYIDYFRFIPDWRIDDLMISYAPKGGSVGRHIDHYDVFLLQTYGTRRWQIETTASDEAEIIAGQEIELLAEFNATASWVLKPGDMLYLPPAFAHYGVALEDCMTWSFGFRAPSYVDLVNEYAANCAASLEQKPTKMQLYQDADLKLQPNPALLDKAVVAKIKSKLGALLTASDADFSRWLGEMLSEQSSLYTVYPPLEKINPSQLKSALNNNDNLLLNPKLRLIYINSDAAYTVFLNGSSQFLTSPQIEKIAAEHKITKTEVDAANLELLEWICDTYNLGYWLFESDYSNE